jgi:hypothetical protein
LYFSEIKCFRELFEATKYKHHTVIHMGGVVSAVTRVRVARQRSNSDFLFQSNHTGFTTHTISYSVEIGGSFPDEKSAELCSLCSLSCISF